MNYLLDTHILLWLRLDSKRVSAEHRAIVHDQAHEKYVSPISFWEISLKYALGKLELGGHTPEIFMESAIALGFKMAELTPQQFASFHNLPAMPGHKDPFDRMLIWQAMQSKMTLMSSDAKLSDYQISGLKLA